MWWAGGIAAGILLIILIYQVIQTSGDADQPSGPADLPPVVSHSSTTTTRPSTSYPTITTTTTTTTTTTDTSDTETPTTTSDTPSSSDTYIPSSTAGYGTTPATSTTIYNPYAPVPAAPPAGIG